MANVKAIPESYTSITPSITFRSSEKAIEFYKRAFGAKDRGGVMKGPDGKVVHAEIQIGSAIIMMNDEIMGSRSAETQGGSPISFYHYVENVDAAFKKAIAEGAKESYPVADMFWGDRMGALTDPFGIKWTLASHIKDVSPEEMKKGSDEFMKQMASH